MKIEDNVKSKAFNHISSCNWLFGSQQVIFKNNY